MTNTSDTPLALYYRTPGQTAYSRLEINPQASMERYLALTAARTVEYYFDVGSILCEVIDFFGTGLTPSSLTVNDVAAWLVMHGYTVGTGGNLTTAEVQLCLDDITAEVNVASGRFTNIAGYAVNASFKNHVTLKGSVAQALYALRNKGASSGLVQDRVIVSTETADRYQAQYEKAIDDMNKGLNLGA